MEVKYPHAIFLRIEVKTEFGLKIFSVSSDEIEDAVNLIKEIKNLEVEKIKKTW